MTRTIATAPGKVMLAGEYAVLDGSRAIIAAIDRRAVATIGPSTPGSLPLALRSGRTGEEKPSPFLRAAREVVEQECGAAIAAGFDELTVDTSALRDGDRKLGVGSSAAATVAAIGAVIAAADHPEAVSYAVEPRGFRGLVGVLARVAHMHAQGAMGAKGSGADVATSTWGGVIDYVREDPPGLRAWKARDLPSDLVLVFAWTGQPADTATLVAAVQRARVAAPAAVDRALAAIAAAADALAAATTAEAAVAAIADGGRAMSALAAATGVALVPPAVDMLAAALAPLGAAAKTTGAGGGDLVLVAAPRAIDRAALDAAIVAAGLAPLALAVDPLGVDIRRDGA